MKKNFILLASFVLTAFVYSEVRAEEDLKSECYKLKEVMEDSKVGRSYTCFYPEIRQCFFTSDQDWYTHTFQIPCRQFKAIVRVAKEKRIPYVSIKEVQKDIN